MVFVSKDIRNTILPHHMKKRLKKTIEIVAPMEKVKKRYVCNYCGLVNLKLT